MRQSPIDNLHLASEAIFLEYGDAAAAETPAGVPVRVVGTYGDLPLEYAAIRRGCALFDEPWRAVIEVTGPDRREFLNRMITQELKDLTPGGVRNAFWLNRKGRIDADLIVAELGPADGDRMLMLCDVHSAKRAIDGLNAYIITEEVTLADRTEQLHMLSLHGPTAAKLLEGIAATAPAEKSTATTTIAGHAATIIRHDATGDPGFLIVVDGAAASDVFRTLIEQGHDAAHGEHGGGVTSTNRLAGEVKLRPAGWMAFNMARIEAGSPLYNIDFGPESLPAESGVLKDRVSFTKGCYLGQEVVARMYSRGHSKQELVAVRFEAVRPVADEAPLLPEGGAPLSPEGGEPIGAITSSTLSPMLGSIPIGFAQVKQAHKAPGTKLMTTADGQPVGAIVQESLRFWSRGNSSGTAGN